LPIIVGVLMLFVYSTNAQENENWIQYKKIDGIQINYKYIECNNPSQGTYKEYIVFKFFNTTDEIVNVSFNTSLWYDGQNKTSDSKENLRELRIEPKQVFETSCDKNKEYNIFSKFLNYKKAELTKFELTGIKISK